MQKERRLARTSDFASVFRHGKRYYDPLISLYVLPNAMQVSRFGFSVSKRVSKAAVVRNKVKRRLREVTRAALICEGWDLVLVPKKDAASATFQELQRAVTRLLNRGRLAGGEAHPSPERTSP